MRAFTEDAVFEGFGGSWLATQAELPCAEAALPGDRRAARRLLRKRCPAVPGVYGMIDAAGQLTYVGQSKALRHRLLSYFSAAADGTKAGRIAGDSRRLLWEPWPHELSALLRELELIRRFRPPRNVRGDPRRAKAAYLCLGRGPAPYAHLVFRPAAREGALFGPVPGTRRSRRTARLVNDFFQLRNCSDKRPLVLADQLELFADDRRPRCLRHALGACLAPCAGGCTRGAYGERVEAARQFLRGCDPGLLGRLADAMQQAAAARRYELAAILRDAIGDLALLFQRLRRLGRARRRLSMVYPVPGPGGGEFWYLIRGGQIAGVAPAARDAESAARCAAMLDEVYRPGPRRLGSERREDAEEMLLLDGWFRRHRAERKRALRPREARELAGTFSANPLPALPAARP